MVNASRVKAKIPSLLVNGSSTEKRNWNRLMRYRYQYLQFKKRDPKKFNSLINKIIVDLNEIEKAVNR